MVLLSELLNTMKMEVKRKILRQQIHTLRVHQQVVITQVLQQKVIQVRLQLVILHLAKQLLLNQKNLVKNGMVNTIFSMPFILTVKS